MAFKVPRPATSNNTYVRSEPLTSVVFRPESKVDEPQVTIFILQQSLKSLQEYGVTMFKELVRTDSEYSNIEDGSIYPGSDSLTGYLVKMKARDFSRYVVNTITLNPDACIRSIGLVGGSRAICTIIQ